MRENSKSAQQQSSKSGIPLCCCAAVLLCCFALGCLEREIQVVSEPEGATVHLNDVEVGRTPLSTDFDFYGLYDIRAEREGFEPIMLQERARAPWYEWPPIDLVSMALPWRFRTHVVFEVPLTPLSEDAQAPEEFERALVERARAMREEIAE